VASLFFARAFVWGDVDPHGCGLGAGEPDGSAVVVKKRDLVLLVRQRRRRLLQVVTGTFPCGQQLVKYGYKEKAECILCKKSYEESGGSWKGEMPKKTISLGQKEVVTVAHNACI